MYHRLRRTVHAVVLTGVSMLIGVLIGVAVNAQTAPDNTKVNTRDRAKGAVTADQQKENAGDREITRKIRQSLIKDKTLSSYAHNVKVIAQGGQVTLKGPVRSNEEKHSVESKAVEVAGVGHVINQMSVAPARTKPAKKERPAHR